VLASLSPCVSAAIPFLQDMSAHGTRRGNKE
jgi:hypothetical protein